MLLLASLRGTYTVYGQGESLAFRPDRSRSVRPESHLLDGAGRLFGKTTVNAGGLVLNPTFTGRRRKVCRQSPAPACVSRTDSFRFAAKLCLVYRDSVTKRLQESLFEVFITLADCLLNGLPQIIE